MQLLNCWQLHHCVVACLTKARAMQYHGACLDDHRRVGSVLGIGDVCNAVLGVVAAMEHTISTGSRLLRSLAGRTAASVLI
jgi:hypothetical protein